MKRVTIDMDGVSTTVQVDGETNEECIKQALMKLHPEKFEKGKYGEPVFEYTVIQRPVCTKQEAQKIIDNVEKEIRKDFGMRGI